MKKNSFSLLEILIALIIFTLGAVVIVRLFGAGLVNSLDAENMIIATNLAQRRIEEIRNLTFANISNEPKDDVAGFFGFQREMVVTAPDGDPVIDDLKEVTVTVYWTFKGDEVSTQLVTYISKN